MNWFTKAQQAQPAIQQQQSNQMAVVLDPSQYMRTRDAWRAEIQQMVDAFVNNRDEFSNREVHDHLNAISQVNERYFSAMEDWMRQGGVAI